ncbi:MAG TPA: ABC transporter ATP-binding protein [Oscillatoriales cyanobacterium M59_W2019_021]|nr:MAG: ABC transporter ATP-binding protein [Cyanobacteria bacterium J055]HIK31831.1 ABC transporter ATP-binding protein [Oscillatoriales cyanobacterium M4454_W2019_049]HIK52839.1 ABC transporter ATP-binding protein [Oscillatoriales cyanobacterium M59_W2019_021]
MLQTASHNSDLAGTGTQFDVELRKVFKVYNGETAVRGVEFEIGRGEFFSILGPSGCGKTTTLRMIAGFELPSAGEILIRGESMNRVPPYQRPVNTVFQSYALFNHMKVWDNIAFGLRIRRLGKAEIQERVDDALRLVKMESFASRYPAQLSGGQRQRIALARALVNRPAVLLLDEPLGALDLKLRKEMQVELSNLHRELGLTFVMVTHDQEEALSLSDRIAVMKDGKIEQIDSPDRIYERPATPFVADFIGDTNLFNGHLESIDRSHTTVRTPTHLALAIEPTADFDGIVQDPVVVSIRPEKINLVAAPIDGTPNCFEGRLKHVMYLGTHIHCQVELISGERLTVRQPSGFGSLPDGDTPVYVCWQPKDATVLKV